MEASSQDRNLPASQRKLDRARASGQVPRSRDLSHLAVLGTGALAMVTLAPALFDRLRLAFGQQLVFDTESVRQPADMLSRLQDMTGVGLLVCGAFAALIAAAVIVSTIASGGWVFSLKPLAPDLSRLNPLQGLGALFSRRKLADVAKMLVITSVLVAVAAHFLSAQWHTVSGLVQQPSGQALATLGNWLTGGVGLLLLVVLALTLIDVPLQAYLYRAELKMSLQEVKDEHKESEGNPLVKRKRRERQRELARRNSIRAVPQADFVVMNPTHYAVAIRYDEASMNAPQVISKGADLLAMKIREIARAHRIPVLESPRLARALYANAELDRDIPASLYTAVAQVLAYVYRLKAALRGQGPMPGEPPEPFVPPELDPQPIRSRAEAEA